MVSLRVSELFQQDTRESGGLLKTSEREKLLLPYLPQESEAQSRKKHKPIRSFLKAQLHFVIYTAIHLCFSLYIRTRRTIRAVLHRVSAILYYHHRTPELIRRDVRGLARLPQHLSVVLTLPSGNDPRNLGGQDGGPEAVRALLDDVAELSAWCASAGIPLLSVYEATGVLTNFVPATHRAVADKLHAYFGARRPSLQVRTPHQPSFLNGDAEEREAVGEAGQDGTSTDIGKESHDPSSMRCCACERSVGGPLRCGNAVPILPRAPASQVCLGG